MDIHARIRIAAVVPASGRITQQVRNSDALLKRTRPTAFINTAARATHSRRKKSVLYARPPRPCRAARGGGLFFLTVLFSLHMLTESLWNALALCAALVALLIWIKKSSTTPSRAALKIYSEPNFAPCRARVARLLFPARRFSKCRLSSAPAHFYCFSSEFTWRILIHSGSAFGIMRPRRQLWFRAKTRVMNGFACVWVCERELRPHAAARTLTSKGKTSNL